MSKQDKIFDLRERLLIFSKRMIVVVRLLPRGSEWDVIRKQLLAAATSIGANYEEADGTLSKKDFVHKLVIARKEARETKYWLRLVEGSILDTKDICADIREIEEIIKILSAMVAKCQDGK